MPKELDWDLWLGVAPERPYHPDYCPFRWRGWKDFGTGAVGDMGIHNAAMPFAGLELGAADVGRDRRDLRPEARDVPGLVEAPGEFPAADGRGAGDHVLVRRRQEAFGRLDRRARGGRERRDRRGQARPRSIRSSGPAATGTCCPRRSSATSSCPSRPCRARRAESHHQEWIRACKGGPSGVLPFRRLRVRC